MIRRNNSVLGISVLCALIFCALAATNASAAQRAFTCAPTGSEFGDAHCKEAGTGFSHVAIANGTPTEIEVTNGATGPGTSSATPWKLEGSLSGIESAVECTTVGGSGDLENNAASVNGSGTLKYTGCSVTKPAGQGCRVRNNEVTSFEVDATTEGQAANTVRVKPAGAKMAATDIENCATTVLNQEWAVSGVVLATATGATLSTTHAGVTGQTEKLKWGGVRAGLESKVTIRMKPSGNPITLT